MFNLLSMVGNGSNVRVNADNCNTASSQTNIQAFRQPGNSMAPSNFRCGAHGIATEEEIPSNEPFVNAVGHSPFHYDFSLLQPHMCEVSTHGFQLRNDFSRPIAQEDTINHRTVPLAGYIHPFDNSLSGSAPRYMTARPERTKNSAQPSVGARFHTPSQKNPASAGDESSVPALVMGDPRLSPTLHPGNNPYRSTFQVVMSEEFEQLNAQYKTRKHMVGTSSPLLPGNTWCFLSDESGATSSQSQEDLQSTPQPCSSSTDEPSSQQGSTHGPEVSPAFNSSPHNPRRRKRSPAVMEQRDDPQEAMSLTLDSHMVPTNPPKRRRLTKEERKRVAHVREVGACPSCKKKHQKCSHVPDANPDSHPLTPESSGPVTPASDIWGAVQVLSPSPGFNMMSDLDLHPRYS